MRPRWILLLLLTNVIYIILGAVCFHYIEYDSDQNMTQNTDMVDLVLQQLPGELLYLLKRCDLLPEVNTHGSRVIALLRFFTGLFYPYPSGYVGKHWYEHARVSKLEVTMKTQLNTLYEFRQSTKSDDITSTKPIDKIVTQMYGKWLMPYISSTSAVMIPR